MNSPDIQSQIQQRLDEIEQQHQVTILHAIESGSRAWGFASSDSDWDVRFIYIHRPRWYLSIHESRDVIELPIEGDLDINGWDLRKSLRLMHKGNPVLFEWLASPIVYRQNSEIMESYRSIAAPFFLPNTAMHHYLHMAKGNFREYLHRDQVRLKKYFYVLRPVLAMQWIEQGWGQPPMLFSDLVEKLVPPGDLFNEIEQLLEWKRNADEKAEGPKREAFHEFLDRELTRLEQVVKEVPRHKPLPQAHQASEEFFQNLVLSGDDGLS